MEIKFVTTRLNHTTQEWENEVIHKEDSVDLLTLPSKNDEVEIRPDNSTKLVYKVMSVKHIFTPMFNEVEIKVNRIK
tara:strand:+ start:1139 stop:1369 length:231 start_codon:yes stop_codon:yes gene_type:complete